MPNKRFLGLGFSFAATDRGLEKKLVGIASALRDISGSLNGIGTAGTKAGKSMGGMKAPRVSRGTQTGTNAKAPSAQAQPKAQGTRYAIFEDITSGFEKVSGETRAIFKNMEEALGPKASKEMFKNMRGFRVEINQLGNISDYSKMRLKRNTEEFIKSIDHLEEFKKKFGIVQKVLTVFKNWMTDIGNSAGRFLHSIGVDLGSMIPEQFKAAFGLFESVVLSPIRKGVSSAFSGISGLFMKKKQKESQDAIMSKWMGKSPGAKHNVLSYLKDISESSGGSKSKEGGDGKKGFFGAIKSFLSGALGVLLSPFSGAIKLITTSLGFVGSLFDILMSPIKSITARLGFFGEVFLPLVVIGTALYGAFKGVMDTLGEWGTFFGGIFDMGKSLLGLTGRFLESIPWLDQLVTAIKDAAMFLVTLPAKILGLVMEGWKNIFGWLGVGAGDIGKKMSDWSKSMDKVQFDKTNPQFPQSQPSVSPGVYTRLGPDALGKMLDPTAEAQLQESRNQTAILYDIGEELKKEKTLKTELKIKGRDSMIQQIEALSAGYG
jgi:hypothetical protein